MRFRCYFLNPYSNMFKWKLSVGFQRLSLLSLSTWAWKGVTFKLHVCWGPAWKIPWTEEPGRLQSMGSLRVVHDWAPSLSLFTFMHWRSKWQPTPVFLPGESQGWGSLVGCCLWGRTESDTTEATYQQQTHVTMNTWYIARLKWDVLKVQKYISDFENLTYNRHKLSH